MPQMAVTSFGGARFLLDLYRGTLEALSGRGLVRAALCRTPIPALRVRIFGLGKAACSMAQGAAEALRVDFSGVLAAHEPAPHPRQLALHVGDHPLPSVASQRAGQALLDAARATPPEDLALFLVSGGGSAIAAVPTPPLTIEDLSATTEALLRSGASIGELNTVRKHVTQLAGGWLAAHCRARQALVLMLSDIASGDLSSIASGPTLPDPSSFADAFEIVERRGAEVPAAVREYLRLGRSGRFGETPKPGDARLRHLRHRVLASPRSLTEEAQARATRQGVAAQVAVSAFDGDLEWLKRTLSERMRAWRAAPPRQPLLLIASGEPRLRVPPGSGSGGRMQQLALSLARDFSGLDFCALCAGSDGRDGPTAFAGALVDGATLSRAHARGVDLSRHLDGFDAATAVHALGIGIDRFASGTNLTDLALILLGPSLLP